MLEIKKIYQNINDVLNCGLVGTFLPLSLTFFGFRKVFKIIMEERIKGLDKKDLFNYLIENRIFLESLTYDEIKHYKKILKLELKKRNKKSFFGVLEYFMNRG